MSVIERERVEVEAPREVTEKDVLLRAAYLYEEDVIDWCRGTLQVGRRSCMVGAVMRAHEELTGDDLGPPTGDKRYEFYVERYQPITGLHWGWNDAPGRTKAEVVSALREAAARA